MKSFVTKAVLVAALAIPASVFSQDKPGAILELRGHR
jgi:hypothetical protein